MTAKGCGTTTLTITAKETANSKAASKTIKITVKPRVPATYAPTSKSKRTIIFKWKKVSEASNYMIRYGTNKSMKGAKTLTVNAKTLSKKISKLTSKKTYYIQIRSYNKSSKLYSNWSGIRSVKVK
ncbi:hypothetical protein P261_01143 [Lachnospiraceae bacterium TWA4]|nr:hypothetical protein P261_01143 [Lachnospiraceae bacterium TWA4]